MSRDLAVPDNVAVANGVVYAVQTGEQTAQHISNPEGHGRSVNGEPPETIASLAKFRSTPLAPMVLYALDAQNRQGALFQRQAAHQLGAFQPAGGGAGQGVSGLA